MIFLGLTGSGWSGAAGNAVNNLVALGAKTSVASVIIDEFNVVLLSDYGKGLLTQMPTMVPPKRIWTTLVGSANPIIAPTITQDETMRATGIASPRFAGFILRRPGGLLSGHPIGPQAAR